MKGMHRNSLNPSLLHKIAFLVASGAAIFVGHEQNAFRNKAQTVLKAKSEPGGTERITQAENREWTRFKKISKELESQGALVQWNHPPEGPKDPFFVVNSAHVSQFKDGVEDDWQATVLAEEYAILCLLAEEGLRKFAFEGRSSNIENIDCDLIYSDPKDGKITWALDERPRNMREPLAKNRHVLAPKKVRRMFANPKTTATFLKGMRNAGGKGLSSELFIASTDPDAGLTFTGAENAEAEDQLEKVANDPRQEQLDAAVEKFRAAIRTVERTDGKFPFFAGYDESGTVVMVKIGEQEFDAITLQHDLSEYLDGSDEDRKIHEAREAFIADDLDADVVHFGDAHLKHFMTRKATRSIGIVVPPSAQKNYRIMAEGSGRTATFLKRIKNLEADRKQKMGNDKK
jgi:hypothetical protein